MWLLDVLSRSPTKGQRPSNLSNEKRVNLLQDVTPFSFSTRTLPETRRPFLVLFSFLVPLSSSGPSELSFPQLARSAVSAQTCVACASL